MTTKAHNPWREPIENILNGDNYFRTSEWNALLADLDRLYIADCKWVDNHEGFWGTSCGHEFILNEGTPKDNGMVYCFYCGGKLSC